MNPAQTAIQNTAADESLDVTKFPHLPIEFIPAEIETNEGTVKGRCFIKVFRYPVEGGWIVGTISEGMQAMTQSFVPDPDHDWYDILPGDETQPTSQP